MATLHWTPWQYVLGLPGSGSTDVGPLLAAIHFTITTTIPLYYQSG